MPVWKPMGDSRPVGTNEFVIKVSNVNGSGSASANGLLSKSIYRMGVPVSAKNIFPSNIQGLPTWYEIRVSETSYGGRSAHIDFLIAMNPRSFETDIREVGAGGYVLYDSTWPIPKGLVRDDLTFLPVPLTEQNVEVFPDPKIRILMKNITYVGAAAAFLNIDIEVIRQLLQETYARKPALSQSNIRAIEFSHGYVLDNFECPIEIRARPSDLVGDRILINGNTACALGAIYAGATVAAWYPITPATSLSDTFRQLAQRFRKDPETGTYNACIIQAEDELAAVGVAVGAGWAGARAFTATSGPGISLMNEFLGFAYFTEIPLVVFDVQRSGPSTGMPTRTQQADVLSTAFASHGDTQHILLFPADPREAFYLSVDAFDFAERFQTPVFVLTDLDIGMNEWLCDPLEWDDSYKPDRGKVLMGEELAKVEHFYRYLDSDGDGVCYRTIPGVDPKGAYFLRGSGHDKYGAYTEQGGDYVENADRLKRKFQTAATVIPKPVVSGEKRSGSAILSFGSCDAAIREARERIVTDGEVFDYVRLRSFPFGDEVDEIISTYDDISVVEQNRDAQLRSLLLIATHAKTRQLRSILSYGGLALDVQFIEEAIRTMLVERDRDEFRNPA